MKIRGNIRDKGEYLRIEKLKKWRYEAGHQMLIAMLHLTTGFILSQSTTYNLTYLPTLTFILSWNVEFEKVCGREFKILMYIIWMLLSKSLTVTPMKLVYISLSWKTKHKVYILWVDEKVESCCTQSDVALEVLDGDLVYSDFYELFFIILVYFRILGIKHI